MTTSMEHALTEATAARNGHAARADEALAEAAEAARDAIVAADRWVCPECGQAFDQKRFMGVHRRYKHGVIGMSDGATRARESRPKERRVESKEACPVCGRTFLAANLPRHLRSKHPASLDGPLRPADRKVASLPAPAAPARQEPVQVAPAVEDGPMVEVPAAVAVALQRFAEVLVNGELVEARRRADAAEARVADAERQVAELRARLDLIQEAMGA